MNEIIECKHCNGYKCNNTEEYTNGCVKCHTVAFGVKPVEKLESDKPKIKVISERSPESFEIAVNDALADNWTLIESSFRTEKHDCNILHIAIVKK